MFKKMTLSMRILCGFLVVVAIAAILGFSGWRGMRSVAEHVRLSDEGFAIVAVLDECGFLRRDFALHGTELFGGNTKNAAELWKDKYAELAGMLQSLKNDPGLDADEKKQIEEAIVVSQQYEKDFAEEEAAQKMRDDAFAEWGRVGWDVTESIGSAQNDTIAPAMANAQAQADPVAIARWAGIGQGLQSNIVEPFLLLRIRAMYLIAKGGDIQYEEYTKQLAALRESTAKWAASVQGEAALEQAATTIDGLIGEYERAGAMYYEGLLKQREAEVAMAASAGGVLDKIKAVQENLNEAKQAIITRTIGLTTILSLGGVAVGLLLAYFIARSISKPINNAITQLSEGSHQLTSAADQISTVSQELAGSTSEQAASLEESSASLEELTSMTHHNADNANQANSMATDVRKAVQDAQTAMERMSAAMGKIRTSADETAKILKSIDEIAFQTNLLALNAAVEAARAGEAGKGFAVVAEEVRALAQRSAEASKSTAALIDESRGNAENGVHASTEVAQILTRIDDAAGNVAQLIAEVSAACREQSSGIDQLNTAVSEMDKAVQSNAASSEESASASEELSAQAREVGGVVMDLAALVGGHGASAGTMTRATSPRRPANRPKAAPVERRRASHPALPSSGRQKSAAGSKATSQSIAPEEVIPLDDDDLSDF